MAGFLSGTGTASYNGVEFPVQIKTRIQAVAVDDDAGRETKLIKHIVTITGTFHNFSAATPNNSIPGTLDDELTGWPSIQRKLLTPGKLFTFTDKGYGASFVVSANKADVVYGPKPRMIEWSESIGSQAVYFTWTCEFHISNCESVIQSGRLIQFVYDMVWSINSAGLTTRTVSGLFEIPATRNPNAPRAIPDTADKYRNKIKVVIPKGYTRESQTFHLSQDKRTLRFSIVDTELDSDSPYFAGIINPNLTYGIENDSLGMSMWLANLSGRIEVAKGYPRWYAWVAFLMVFNTKKDEIRRGKDRRGKPARFVLISHIRIDEEIFGRGMSFNLSWTLSCSLKDILPASGFWVAVKGTSWEVYRNSMNKHWSVRGFSEMAHTTSEDEIVNLCNDSNIVIGKDTKESTPEAKPYLIDDYTPDVEQSWLHYYNTVTLKTDSESYAHKPLTRPESYSPGEMTAASQAGSNPHGDTVPPIFHRRTQSGYYVRMFGWAMRAGFPIPEPELLKYGGRKATPVGKGEFSHVTIGQFTAPVYLAQWDKLYVLDGTPQGDATEFTPDSKSFKRMK